MLHTPQFYDEDHGETRGSLANSFSLFYHDASLIALINLPDMAIIIVTPRISADLSRG